MNRDKEDDRLLDLLDNGLTESEFRDLLCHMADPETARKRYEELLRDSLLLRWGIRRKLVRSSFSRLQRHLRWRRMRRTVARYAVAAAVLLGAVLAVSETDVLQRRSAAPAGREVLLELASGRLVSLTGREGGLQEEGGADMAVSGGRLEYRNSRPLPCKEAFHTLTVPRGGEFMVCLEDGTRVHLNACTEFRYPVHFTGTAREVELEGEAFFDVRSDSCRPFVVKVGDCAVRAVGTRFNINSHRRNLVETVLVSGQVIFCRGGLSYGLEPGELAVYDGESGETRIRGVDVEPYIAWTEGNFVFKDDSLDRIMETLSCWYDMDLVYTDPEVRNVRLTGKIQRFDDIRELLYFIERISDIEFAVNGRVITASRRKR